MNYTTLLVEKDGPVDWLTFNRPDALNSLSRRMVEELHHYFDSLQANYDVRVVVMRGEGRMPDSMPDPYVPPELDPLNRTPVQGTSV